MTKLSVIIPTLNEEKYLKPTLESLTKQTYQNFELIVKDGLSTDNTISVAKEYTDIVIARKDISIGDARNQGAQHVKGDVLVFLDADTSLDISALEYIAKDFNLNNIILLLPKYGPLKGSTDMSKTKKDVARFLIGFENFWRKHVDRFCGGMLMPVKTSAFKKVGGFNRRIKCCEDIELSYRLRKVGNIMIDYRVKAYFSIRRFVLSGFIETLHDYGLNAIRMHLKLFQPEFKSFR